MKGTTDSEVAGRDLMSKYEQNVNQVLMPETMFLAVPSANLYDWEIRFSSLSCQRRTENKQSHHGAVNLKLPTGTVTLTMPAFPTDPNTFSALSESCLLEIWSARKLDLVSIFLGIG